MWMLYSAWLTCLLSESPEDTKHKDLCQSEIQKSEKSVLATCESINTFVNPFAVEDKNRLYCISSGVPVPSDIGRDVMRAKEAGKKSKEEFIHDRLAAKKEFFMPVKRLNLKSIATMH